ncbi:MAG: hypothetical protein WC363_00715 [Candidatus Izemoplasmatales bacterium]|jgi:hypothetical protein
MSDYQALVLKKTTQVIRPFHWWSFLINVAIASVIVIALVWLLTQELNWIISLAVIPITFVYNLLKDRLNRIYMHSIIQRQYAYTIGKHPEWQLYIPVFSDATNMYRLKSTALLFRETTCSLITFKHRFFAKYPDDSILVPLGKDFSITSFEPVPKQPYGFCHISLMGTDFTIGVLYDEKLIKKIQSVIDDNTKDV